MADLAYHVAQAHILLHARLPRSKWVGPNLRGACAIGAFYLLEVLFRAGVRGARPVHYHVGSYRPEHWWVKVGLCHLDPTYIQFDEGRPWICGPKHPLDGIAAHVGAKIPEYWPQQQRLGPFWATLGL